MDELKGTNLAPVADLARRAVATEITHIKRERDGDVPVIVTDKGREIHSAKKLVDEYERTQPAPYRRRGTYKAADIKSLLDWMEKNCAESAPVFAQGAENLATEWQAPKLALLGVGNYSEKDRADWHDFNVRYDFPVTRQWTDWVKSNSAFMSQADFAEFVEEHLYEFSEPYRGEDLGEAVTRMIEALGGTKHVANPAKIYDMARGVKLTVSEKVEVALDRTTGEASLKFSEEHTGAAGRPVAIPKFFYIRIPVFFGEEPSLIGALLRYRNAGGGNVVWAYELFAPDLIVKAAFERACEIVKRASRTLYLGTPDAP